MKSRLYWLLSLIATYIQIFAFRGQYMIDFLHERFEELIDTIHQHEQTALCAIWIIGIKLNQLIEYNDVNILNLPWNPLTRNKPLKDLQIASNATGLLIFG